LRLERIGPSIGGKAGAAGIEGQGGLAARLPAASIRAAVPGAATSARRMGQQAEYDTNAPKTIL